MVVEVTVVGGRGFRQGEGWVHEEIRASFGGRVQREGKCLPPHPPKLIASLDSLSYFL